MDIKPTLLLAMALFLVSAPDPDSRAIAEMTANFIVPSNERALQAAELGEVREEAIQAEKSRDSMESDPVTDNQNAAS